MSIKSIILLILGLVSFILLARTLVELGWSYWGRPYKHKYGIALLFCLAILLILIAAW